MTFSISSANVYLKYTVLCHRCFSVFNVNIIYMSTTTVIYLYSTVVLLAPLMLVVIE